MLNIYLVRHGQDFDNSQGILNGHRDTPLTELGLAQADELTLFIKEHDLGLVKVYTSPLQRAYTTAEKITTALGLPSPEVLPLLIERNFGEMTGLHKTAISELETEKVLKTKTIDYFLEPVSGESFPQAMARAKELLDFITNKHSDGNILLVSHGDFSKMIYAAYYNLPWKEALEMFHFGNTEIILLAPGTLSEDVKIFTTPQFNI